MQQIEPSAINLIKLLIAGILAHPAGLILFILIMFPVLSVVKADPRRGERFAPMKTINDTCRTLFGICLLVFFFWALINYGTIAILGMLAIVFYGIGHLIRS